MFLEAILYFVLGFLCAGLLALMISPIIWSRAVLLTKHKIESSVPLTLNEIQAEKDQLRAEFAMSTRKLEINLEQLQDKVTAQVIELNQKRDQLSKLDFDNLAVTRNLDALQDEKVALVAQINERTNEYDHVKSKFENLTTQHSSIDSEVKDLRDALADKQELINSQRIELAAKNTKIDALNEAMKMQGFGDGSNVSKEIEKLNETLAEQRAVNVDLEARLASHALKMESAAETGSDANVKDAVEIFQDNLNIKNSKIKEIEKERDALIEEVQALSTITKEEWASERKNNTLLRERINDMAAKIAVLTQEIEGEQSPIAELLKSEPKTKSRGKAKAGGTLAARIRALQETTNTA